MKLKLFTKITALVMAVIVAFFVTDAKAVTFTSNPKIGGSVQSGAVITLTFEDVAKVTENYEKLCICTQNGTNYRIRTNSSRNRLEITLVADPKPGEFQIKIASGYIVLDGVPYEEELLLTYNFRADGWINEVNVTPDVNKTKGMVDELGDVEYEFLGAKRVTYLADPNLLATLSKDGVVIKTYGASDVRCAMNIMTFFNDPAYTETGYYVLALPASSYEVDGNEGISSWNYAFRISETTVNYNPSEESVKTLEKIEMTFADASTVTEAKPAADNVTLTDGDGNAIAFTCSLEGNVFTVVPAAPLTSGECTLFVPGGTFSLDDTVYSKNISRKYVIEDTDLHYTVSATPANNATLFGFDGVDIKFDGIKTTKWTITSSANAPYLDVNGNRRITFSSSAISATGDMLSIVTDDIMTEAGVYQVVIPADGFTLDGQKTLEDIILTYNVKEVNPSFNPAPGEVGDLSKIEVTFEGIDNAELAEGMMPTLKNAAGEAVTVTVSAEGNVVTLIPDGKLANGKYNLEFAANTMVLDGATYSEVVKAAYTYVNLPDYALSADPQEGVVESLSNIALTFAGVTEVKVGADAAAPTLSDKANNGEVAVFAASAAGNVLTLALAAPIEAAGEYVVTIPAGACTLDGAPVNEIVLTYEIKANSVNELATSDAKVTVISIDGKVVAKDADASSLKLNKGVYIVNGKKVMK